MAQSCKAIEFFALKALFRSAVLARKRLSRSMRSAAQQRLMSLDRVLREVGVEAEVAKYVYSPFQVDQQASALAAPALQAKQAKAY